MLHGHLQLLAFTNGFVGSTATKTSKATRTIATGWSWSLIFNHRLQVACFQYRTHTYLVLLEQLRNLIAMLFPVLEVGRTLSVLELERVG